MVSSYGFTPQQIDGNILWLDASDAGAVRRSGNTVTGWIDKSGSGNDVSQLNRASAPAYGVHQLNGLQTLTFNGASSFLSGSNAAFSASVFNESTVFIVTNATSSKQASSVVWTGAYLSNPRMTVRLTEANVSHFDFNNKTDGRLVATDIPNGPALWTALGSFSSHRQSFSKDGTVIASDAGPSGIVGGNYPLVVGAMSGSGQTGFYFGGDVAEIVVYKSALSPRNVSQVEAYLGCKWGLSTTLPSNNPYKTNCSTPSPSPTVATPNAAAADTFVNSIGVNTHLSYDNTVYGHYLTSPAPNGYTIVSALQALGTRHIRDGSMNTAAGAYRCPIYQRLFAHGIDVDAVIANAATTADVADMAKCLGPALFALEGPNEFDNAMHFNPAFALQDVAEMKMLHDARGSAYATGVKLFAPSTVESESDVALAGVNNDTIAGYVDYTNGHVYFGDRNPESSGWGGNQGFGVYGALTTDMNAANVVAPGKPYVTTETGYTDRSDSPTNVNSATKATYLLRDVFEHWLLGATYAYIYEFAKENGSWGIMDESLNPRPAYTALQNTIAILKDPGAALTPKYLGYSIEATADVQHILLQKHDGSNWLVLWQNDAIADPNTGSPVAVSPTTATVSFANVPAALRLFTIDPNTGQATSTAVTTANSATINVTTTPEILQIGTAPLPVLH